MQAWLIWLIVAGMFAAAETASTTLVFVMFGGGAAAASVAAALGANVVVQGLIAIAVSIALLAGLRPVIRRHMVATPPAVTNSDRLVGRDALVLKTVTAHAGLVRLMGGEWTARTADRQLVLPKGAVVRVVEIDGATAVVTLDPDQGYQSETVEI